MTNEDIARKWLAFADSDLSSAVFLLDKKPQPVEIICYHCQQTAEKCMKGFLAYHGKQIPKTHQLMVLNELCKEIDANYGDIESECIALTDYATDIRYPFELELEPKDTREAIRNAEKIKAFVDALLDLPVE
jgi:HEPN domain-containing protein